MWGIFKEPHSTKFSDVDVLNTQFGARMQFFISGDKKLTANLYPG